jgi:hypothetical protein
MLNLGAGVFESVDVFSQTITGFAVKEVMGLGPSSYERILH